MKASIPYPIKKIVQALFDEVFPDQCISCGASHTHLCQTCQLKLQTAEPHPSPWIMARFSYKDPTVRKLIVWMKKHPDLLLIDFFAESIAHMILEELSERNMFGESDSIVIVPIPIDYTRFRERGYNQSELLAQKILARLSLTIPSITYAPILEKRVRTKKQAVVHDRSARLRNIRGAFRSRPSVGIPLDLSRKTIVLIDDVSTTGATLADAKRALRSIGARTVIGAVIAH